MQKHFQYRIFLSWDNVGLLAGRRDKQVKKICVALDATDGVVEEAVRSGADMLLTHLPVQDFSLPEEPGRIYLLYAALHPYMAHPSLAGFRLPPPVYPPGRPIQRGNIFWITACRTT